MIALKTRGAGDIGMIGGERKVQRVFDQLRKRKVSKQELAKLYALPAPEPSRFALEWSVSNQYDSCCTDRRVLKRRGNKTRPASSNFRQKRRNYCCRGRFCMVNFEPTVDAFLTSNRRQPL
jgi:hypothetical protein